ncbi:MAG: site-specific DNA-methyltransferase [Bacillota bacterium]
MARNKKTENQRQIAAYEHYDKQRLNNPQVGLVTTKTDPDKGTKKTYTYDPHIDPSLSWDQQVGRKEIEERYAHLRALIYAADKALQTLEKAESKNEKNEELEKLQKNASNLFQQVKEAADALEKPQLPYLNWAGKAEHTSFEVPTVSLHVHERIDPNTIIDAVRQHSEAEELVQLSFFQKPQENLPIRKAIDFYKHPHDWSNRLIAGDSLLVMNSLLEKEGLSGKVQMIYIDPPYGIKYGSNFQPFVNKRDVKDGKDEDLTAEPEQIRAFRDTWELGIHSYLTYIRDRLLLARELLSESGSIFVQISDENIHLLRNLLDEVFGKYNFVSQISFSKAGGGLTTIHGLSNRFDYILWYSKNKKDFKYYQLYEYKFNAIEGGYTQLELADGSIRTLNDEERADLKKIPADSKLFMSQVLTKPGPGVKYTVEFDGELYDSGKRWWGTPKEGIIRLINKNRIFKSGTTIRYKRFLDDFPYSLMDNLWIGFGGQTKQIYVVQTNEFIIQRCLLMTTDPGDLVFDPTCGSGTTAYVAEQWGRRWITCDTSRVALTLAKQRLMTAVFDYYKLAHPEEGVGSGFLYKTVPHITLKSIANNEPPAQETLYDQPLVDRKKTRISGPFTVEAVPAPAVKAVDDILSEVVQPADASIARSGETLRQSEWRDELLRTGIRGKAGQHIRFARLEPLPGCRWLHADGETRPSDEGADTVRDGAPAYSPMRVVVSFGPEHAPLEQRQVEEAIEETQMLVPRPKLVGRRHPSRDASPRCHRTCSFPASGGPNAIP